MPYKNDVRMFLFNVYILWNNDMVYEYKFPIIKLLIDFNDVYFSQTNDANLYPIKLSNFYRQYGDPI